MYVYMVEIEKSTYFFSITLGILNSSFVPAVGHLQVEPGGDNNCWK